MLWESFPLVKSIDLFIWILTLLFNRLFRIHIKHRISRQIIHNFTNLFIVRNFILEITQQKQQSMFPTELNFIPVLIMKKLMMT